ncbi:hypothetical protein [Aeromicrobium terrae]|uniref:Uncharacterized protein n=1 Tax=Aeromicrobium terrae TaxID=2498846 RepID=A0A5C8NJF1_9ACTN|nr:hypothetical protein [Aeromicrobium terrae]TXL61994.1 hypothetical protein FHP06_04585 [Aeromicrobium terrae]
MVLATPLRSSLGLSGEHDGLAVVDLRHPDAVESVLGRLHDGGDVPIVTCAAADEEAVRRLITFTQIRYPGFRACLEPLPGTPLAVGVVSSLVDDLHGDDVFAWRLAALDLLRASLWSAVWLPSVTGLSTPTPSLFQHVRSWLPGSGFLAVAAPEPRVLPARSAPVSGVEARPDSALIHSPLTRPTWVVDAVAKAVQPQSVSAVETVREPIDVYGTEAAVELVAVPVSFASASRPDSAAVVACPACGVRHARPTCPVCKMSAQPGRATQGARP